jgi:acyl-CoA thioesterase I
MIRLRALVFNFFCTLLLLALCMPLTAHAQSKSQGPILIVGDSLSAEYGLKRGTGWVALLEKQLATEKFTHKVVNASISGETTSGGAQRIKKLIEVHKPSLVVLELGGNDALRGLPMKSTESNLAAMVSAAREGKAQVLILGMRIPPNFGQDYSDRFEAVFKKLATDNKTGFVPFFLKDVGDAKDPQQYFQADRIHPNEQAQPIMMQNVWPALRPLLKKA